MTPSSEPLSALEQYSFGYQNLFHDRRLFKGFQATLSSILSSGRTCVRQTARIRAQHNRLVRPTPSGKVVKLFESVQSQPPLGTLEMSRPVQEGDKRKKRLVTAVTRSTQVWLSEPFTPLGVVNLQFQAHSHSDPDKRGWVLLTNLPLESARDAKHIVALYASRWAIEEIFAWTKTALKWEAARVLSFDAFKRLVVLAWIAAAFLYDACLSPYLAQRLALEQTQETLEQDYQARRAEFEDPRLKLEAKYEEEVAQALEARGGHYRQSPYCLRLEPAHQRLRILDEAALLEWLSKHRPQWVRHGPLLHALKPEGEGLWDLESGATLPWPPGLETVSARAHIYLDQAPDLT